ncbi:MAG: hypothetical protein ACHQXA_05025 [Gemmatimonadales bacterium]
MRKILALAALIAGAASSVSAQKRPASPTTHPLVSSSGPAAYWQSAVGMSAGFTHNYIPSANLTLNSFAGPLMGSDPAVIAAGGMPQPSLFAVLPLGGRWAVEPAADIHNYSQASTHLLAVTIGARLDFALSHSWYAAGGGSVNYADGNGLSGETRGGAGVALGARFHLMGPVGGRLELGYSFMAASKSLAGSQTMSYLFAMTVPLH